MSFSLEAQICAILALGGCMRKAVCLLFLSVIGFVLAGLASGGVSRYTWEGLLCFFVLWLVLVFFLEWFLYKDKLDALYSALISCTIMVLITGWASNYSCDYLVFRTKLFFKLKYQDELVLRGVPFSSGDAYGVYYVEDEPEYYFHAHARLLTLENLEDGYIRAKAAAAIDDELEAIIQDVIDGEYKMSSNCLTMGLHESFDSSNVYSMMAGTSYYQMYLILDEALIEKKDEIVHQVCELIKPYFWNSESTIYFAFADDPANCERFSEEFYHDENILIQLTK